MSYAVMAVVVSEERAWACVCDCDCDCVVGFAEEDTSGVRARSERCVDIWLLEVGRAAISGGCVLFLRSSRSNYL